MFQKFYNDNITTKFIKSLIETTYVPTIDTWKPGKKLIKDFSYITRDYIVKAKKDYIPKIVNNKWDLSNVHNNEYFKIIEPYVVGKFYKGLTSNYVSNINGYDPMIHYQLGRYLRLVRDLYNIDLMSLYNCWSGEFSKKLRIQNNSLTEDNKQDDGFKVLLVPIKYNQKYTIYINSDYPISICSIYYDGKTKLSNYISDIQIVNKISYNSPYLFKGINGSGDKIEGNANASLLEEYLTLLIQIPERNNSGVLILEGDYTQNKLYSYNKDNKLFSNKITNIFYGTNDLNNLIEEDKENYFRTESSLCRISDNTFAFNDRLLEYLLLNVINNEDNISKNIERIQSYATSSKNLILNKTEGTQLIYNNPDEVKGIWDFNLRKYLYDLTVNNIKTPKVIDINGYVDKDIEQIISRGQE